VSTHPYFLDTRSTKPALATLTTLYVERTHHCWKEPEVTTRPMQCLGSISFSGGSGFGSGLDQPPKKSGFRS